MWLQFIIVYVEHRPILTEIWKKYKNILQCLTQTCQKKQQQHYN